MKLFAKEFGKAFIFKKIRPTIRSFFLKAGYDDVPYEMFGYLFYFTLLLTYIIYIVFLYPRLSAQGILTMASVTFLSWVVIPLIIVSLFSVYIYFALTIRISKRTKEIEKVLPEYLQVVSS